MKTEEKKEPKVIKLGIMPELSEEEKAIMKQANEIQQKRKETLKAEETKVLAELKKEFGLGKEEIDQAVAVELSMSKPEAKITTVLEALAYYNESGLDVQQITFLAITSNSRANYLQHSITEYDKTIANLEKSIEDLINIKFPKLPPTT